MSFTDLLPFLMFAAAIAALLRGFPVAFTLAGVGLLFALIGVVFLRETVGPRRLALMALIATGAVIVEAGRR